MHIHHSPDNENQHPLDDLGQFFKAQAEGLTPEPPQEAWHRLETKLESRRINRKLITYRYTSIAAAAVGILALIMATQLIGRIGKFTEEIAVKQDTLTQDQQRIAEAIRQHREEQITLNDPIADGSSNDAPAPRTTTEPISQPPTPKASQRDIRRKADEPNRRDALDAPPAPIAQKEVAIKKQETRNDVIMVEEEAEEITDVDNDEYVLDDMTRQEAPAVVQNDARPASPSPPTKDSPTVAQRVTASDVQKITQTAPSTSLNSPSSYSDRASRSRMQGSMGLQLFDWLSGNWNTRYDAWRFDRNRNEMIGTSGDQAPMRITQARGQLSLMLIGEKRAFEVTQELGSQITFERSGRAFPKRVTITRLSPDKITIRLSEGRLTPKTKVEADYARFFEWDDSGASLQLTRK